MSRGHYSHSVVGLRAARDAIVQKWLDEDLALADTFYQQAKRDGNAKIESDQVKSVLKAVLIRIYNNRP